MNGSQNNDILNEEIVFFKDMTPSMLTTFQWMDQHPGVYRQHKCCQWLSTDKRGQEAGELGGRHITGRS